MKYLRAGLFAAATVVIYLGLPLLGWGLADWGGFFSLAPRTGYAAIVGLFALAVGVQAIGGTEGIRGGKGDISKLNRRETIVRIGLVIGLYLALAGIPFADRYAIGVFPEGPALRWLGDALSALGYGFVFWSGLALGKQYSPEVTIQKDHRLITSGPFRWIRHPRYLGVILLTFGLSLTFRSWIGLGAAPFLIAILLLRIHDEEELLGREFGAEWDAYCRTSARLMPGIW
ncbi:MAG: isoprenylcysteine carboxylmethyltransferase family protein [Anaerolineales bacterium]